MKGGDRLKGYSLSDTDLRSLELELANDTIPFADSRWRRYCRRLVHDTWMARRRLDAIWQACIGNSDEEVWRDKFREIEAEQARTREALSALTKDLDREKLNRGLAANRPW